MNIIKDFVRKNSISCGNIMIMRLINYIIFICLTTLTFCIKFLHYSFALTFQMSESFLNI